LIDASKRTFKYEGLSGLPADYLFLASINRLIDASKRTFKYEGLSGLPADYLFFGNIGEHPFYVFQHFTEIRVISNAR
jgi:hypothetical protein